MRKFKFGLMALVASAAVAIPAGSAVAGTDSTSSSSTALTGCITICVDVLHNGVTIETGDIASTNVTNVCVLSGILNQNVILLNAGNVLTCTNGNKMKKHP
jgi:hypothetical protein